MIYFPDTCEAEVFAKINCHENLRFYLMREEREMRKSEITEKIHSISKTLILIAAKISRLIVLWSRISSKLFKHRDHFHHFCLEPFCTSLYPTVRCLFAWVYVTNMYEATCTEKLQNAYMFKDCFLIFS